MRSGPRDLRSKIWHRWRPCCTIANTISNVITPTHWRGLTSAPNQRALTFVPARPVHGSNVCSIRGRTQFSTGSYLASKSGAREHHFKFLQRDDCNSTPRRSSGPRSRRSISPILSSRCWSWSPAWGTKPGRFVGKRRCFSTTKKKSGAMSDKVLIYILRRDLRLADNPIFHELARAQTKSFTHVLPVYIFSAEQIEISGFLGENERSPYREARSETGGFWRCGARRATFIAESVWDLKTSLEGIGSSLTIRVGSVGHVVRELLKGLKESKVDVAGVWMTSEEGVEEKREEREVRRLLEADGKELRLWHDEKYLVDE